MRDVENPYAVEEEGQADEDDGLGSGRGEDDIGGNDKNGSKRKLNSKKKEKTSQYYRLKPPPRIITNELDLDK